MARAMIVLALLLAGCSNTAREKAMIEDVRKAVHLGYACAAVHISYEGCLELVGMDR